MNRIIPNFFLTQNERVVGFLMNHEVIRLHNSKKLTNLVVGFARLANVGTLTCHNLPLTSKDSPNLNISFSIGGLVGSQHFSEVASKFEKRTVFVKSVISALEKKNFDGVDIAWISPRTDQDWENYLKLMRELRESLHRFEVSVTFLDEFWIFRKTIRKSTPYRFRIWKTMKTINFWRNM